MVESTSLLKRKSSSCSDDEDDSPPVSQEDRRTHGVQFIFVFICFPFVCIGCVFRSEGEWETRTMKTKGLSAHTYGCANDQSLCLVGSTSFLQAPHRFYVLDV